MNGCTPTWIPLHPTLVHFKDAMARPYFWDDVKNSLIIVAVTVVASMVLAFLAAVALAKYRFTGRKAFIVLMIGILMLPQAGLIIPLYVVLARYHLTNTLIGVILTYMTFVIPFAVWTLRGFIVGIPKDLEEAAGIDGASRLGFFWRMVLPLSVPGLITVGILAFIASWNSYLLPLFILNDQDTFTLPLGVQAFSSQYSVDTAKVLAFTSLSMIPALVFFSLFERRIVGGLTGAVKG